jgi:hypothetical protein
LKDRAEDLVGAALGLNPHSRLGLLSPYSQGRESNHV